MGPGKFKQRDVSRVQKVKASIGKADFQSSGPPVARACYGALAIERFANGG